MKVGDPNNDHKCWERVEDMDTLRITYKIDTQNPGSDVATETAAALAAASLVFHRTDPSYSRRLIRASIMEFLIGEEKSFEDYKDHADSYICSVMPGTSASGSKYTPVCYFCIFLSHDLCQISELLQTCNVLLGNGGDFWKAERNRKGAGGLHPGFEFTGDVEMSYMVGYGSNYPQRIHHRGSSLPSVAHHPEAFGCSEGFQFLNSNAPNRNILVGAVVGGPNANDQFPDSRHDYQHFEPTTYINAPLLGSLTYLAHCTTRS